MQSLKHELQSLDQAKLMLDAFASVGATHFDVTFLDIEGKKRGFRPTQSTGQVKHSLPLLFPGLRERQNSLVVRPHSDTATLIQLDDLKHETLVRLRDVSFVTLQTSPGNHQAWVAVAGLTDPKDFSRRLRKGAQADVTASGATRVAGTLNYKRKYEPDFPMVAIEGAHQGRVVTPQQLEALGLVAAPEPAAPATPLRSYRFSHSRSWPDYQNTLSRTRLKNDGTPDRSVADFNWSMKCITRRKSIEETINRLIEVSERTREQIASRDPGYARVTVENAAETVARNRERSR
jgi:hypothetical protein